METRGDQVTAPTIPPQQPEPERECGNCEHILTSSELPGKGLCAIHEVMPPLLRHAGPKWELVATTDTCVLFRARKES